MVTVPDYDQRPLANLPSDLFGWYLGKCMVETRGFLWPWFIHLVQDVLIFFVMTVGDVAASGH